MQRQLGTSNRAAAKRKLERLLASEAPASTALPSETFEQAARRVNEQRQADGVQCACDELVRLERYAFSIFGGKPAAAVTTADVNDSLDYCKSQGKSRGTVVHLRQAIKHVFRALRREQEITVSPVDDSVLPRFRAEVKKERAVLTDDELAAYLAYVHPVSRHRTGLLERQVMACVARCFGGLRTGDLLALDWRAFDVDEGAFQWGWAPRQKTKRPQLLEVPAMLRGVLRDWWERHGRPLEGPVFPALIGPRAGETKRPASFALQFRRDLRRAFGIDALDPETGAFRPVRPLTRRERELFEPGAFTLPVDFHSWRRAYSQALADADVSAQQATALAGHASLAAHARYLASSGKLRKVPEAALPRLLPPPPAALARSTGAPRLSPSPMAKVRSDDASPDGGSRKTACGYAALARGRDEGSPGDGRQRTPAVARWRSAGTCCPRPMTSGVA